MTKKIKKSPAPYKLYKVEEGDVTEITAEEALNIWQADIERPYGAVYGSEFIIASAKNPEEALMTAQIWDKSGLPAVNARHPFVRYKAMRAARTSGYTGNIDYITIK